MAKSQKQKPMKRTEISAGAKKVIKPGMIFKSRKSTVERQGNKNHIETILKKTSNIKNEQHEEGLDTRNYKDGVRVLFEISEKMAENKNKTQLFDDTEEPIFLQITGIKISKCRDHTVRIDLPHSFHAKDPEICFISADLPNTNLRDYDKVTDHYENILRDNNVSNIKKIMSFHELRNSYQEFEMKRKLCTAYNVFLADSKIHGKVVHFLGSSFNKKHKLPRVISFDKPKIKSQIERILAQTNLRIHNKGNATGIQVGRIGMKQKHVLDNVYTVTDKLSSIYPGGSANIRSINIKTTNCMAVPLYFTLKMKSAVDIPKLEVLRSGNNVTYTDELSTRMKTMVTVLPSGHVKTEQIKKRINHDISINIDKPRVKSKSNADDLQFNVSLESDNKVRNIDTKEEIACLIESDKIKKDSKSVLLEDEEIESDDNNEKVLSLKKKKIVKTIKGSKLTNYRKVDVKTPKNIPTTIIVGETPSTAKEGVKMMSSANSVHKEIVTSSFIKGTHLTSKDKRKSTSFAKTTGIQKKKVKQTPFYNKKNTSIIAQHIKL